METINNIIYDLIGSSDETVYAFRHERSLAHNISECARAALSAPARNCDLYATEGEAYQAYLTAMKNETRETYMYFEPWLFAEVKGEAK